MGSGTDVSGWPVVTRTGTIAGWWPAAQGYCNGLVLWRGKLWAAPRLFYDTNPPATMSIYAQDGETLTFQLPRQVFAGFVKRGPGADPLLGCGGYESGQGSSSGPSLATLSGQPLVRYGWPSDPGAVGANGVPANWNGRAPRDPNYFPVNHQDSWVAWEPRVINGEMQGRWACDCIYGGGLVLPEGICYWAHMGTGDIDYARQRATFAAEGAERTYVYSYDRTTYALQGFGQSQDVGAFISGQELGPDGKVYLAQGNAWASGRYRVDVALKVFG
jgi:hypothetical protein